MANSGDSIQIPAKTDPHLAQLVSFLLLPLLDLSLSDEEIFLCGIFDWPWHPGCPGRMAPSSLLTVCCPPATLDGFCCGHVWSCGVIGEDCLVEVMGNGDFLEAQTDGRVE